MASRLLLQRNSYKIFQRQDPGVNNPDHFDGDVVIKIFDKITRFTAYFSAWMLFGIGIIVTFEVIMRKVFNSPTIWVDETARFCLVWAVYLASAHILKCRELITVELFTGSLPPAKLKVLEYFALIIIAIFSAVATYTGTEVVLESIEIGRKTSTMLGVPKWITESAVPVGFGLLWLQAVVEMIKLAKGDEVVLSAEHKI
ncbi:TRAP transporter small permease [Desulforhopalus sp. 52FAK]